MALAADKLINKERFSGENVLQFLLYLPFGLVLLGIRILMALILWIASIILPNKSTVRQMLSTFACWTFGVYVKSTGTRDSRCSVMVANYVSCLDSLAASHILGTISLRKWKVPPFFASTLGIRNAAQFMRKQHFADTPRKGVLLQPEGGPTSGAGLLQFCDWPFPLGNRVQPVAISVERAFTRVTVHDRENSHKFPWADAMWFLISPVTLYTVKLLPALERHDLDDAAFVDAMRDSIAEALGIEKTDYKWEALHRDRPQPRREPSSELTRLASQVKEVLPRVPMRDIIKDLSKSRSVDVTITNFLEGITLYTPEPESEPAPTTSSAGPRYITPVPTGTFPKNAKDRQISFQEKKAQMIAEARKRYIEKHGLNIALNNC